MKENRSTRIFYGWWIVVAAFLNLFFAVGIIFYGFPVFYPAFVESLGFARAQVTQGFLLGFLIVGLPFGFAAGALIDRIGSRWIILAGAGIIGVSLFLMGFMTRFWEYELLCIAEVLGFVLAGPIANQVLIAQWFRRQRGRAMGFAYLGLGFGGVVSPLLVSRLIRTFGWRHALGTVGMLILIVLFPVGILLTRSTPAEIGLLPDGDSKNDLADDKVTAGAATSSGVAAAARTPNFWLILAGSTLVVGAIGAVIQHFILFLRDQGYSPTAASRFSTVLLASSLGGRVLGRVFGGSVLEERHHGSLLFVDWPNDSNTLHIAPASCHLVFCPGVWVCNGRRLHVDSTGHGGMLRHRGAWKDPRADHHGILARSVGSAVDGGKNVR